MRKIFWLLLLLTVFEKTLEAQKTNDNTIIVSGYVSHNKILEALTNEGIGVTNSDTSAIITNWKEMGLSAAAYSTPRVAYVIQRTDTSVIFKGFVSNKVNVVIGVNVSTKAWVLSNYGEKKSAFRLGFAMMSKIANSFGLPVTYLKEETKK